MMGAFDDRLFEPEIGFPVKYIR